MPKLIAPSKDASALLPAFAELPDHAIHLPQASADFEAARTALCAAPFLGFDTESKPLFSIGQHDSGPHLVQLATTTEAWLLQMHQPEAVALARDLLAAPQITKVGFGLDNDRQSLRRRLGIEPANLVDLDRIFSRHGYGHNVGVRAAVALVLERSFRKSKKTSTSNWSVRTLSPAQVRYAANDAQAPAAVWAALPAWQARQPAPPAARRPRQHPSPRESTPKSPHPSPAPSKPVP
jgi:ribonuclease D